MNWVSRYLAVLESREQLKRDKWAHRTQQEQQVQRLHAPAEIPNDLEAVIAEESERWLRDEQRQQMRDIYVEHGDWNAVRRAFGIGAMS